MKDGEQLSLIEFKQDYGIVDADGPPKAYVGADEYYVCLVAGGIKHEGDDFPFICKSEDEAVKQYFKTLADYLGTKRIIIWRTRPELVVFQIKGVHVAWERHYQVYSRLIAY